MSVTEYVVTRGFLANGESYARGDVYPTDQPQRAEAVPLLCKHGLIAPRDEAERKEARLYGGKRGNVPALRGD